MTRAGDSGTKSPCACVVGPQCSVKLWSLSSEERLRRQFRAAGVTDWVGMSEVPAERSVVLVRGDHLFEDRTVADLVQRENFILCQPGAKGHAQAVAAHVPGTAVAALRSYLEGEKEIGDDVGFEVGSAAALSPAYVRKVFKASIPVVLPIRPERAAALERRLFDGSYKGVTDLVTKWVWPRPARWFTGVCARNGIRPNTVTLMSLVLVLIACAAFAEGWYALGLLAAWVMTFLDTVDGKLARVTVDSSPFGNVFDHGIDLVHPPFWYLAWGWGLPAAALPSLGLTLRTVITVIVVAYIAGRLVEVAFNKGLFQFSIFSWRPVDSYFRLIMARRNPNLLLLTASALAGRPELGLAAVAVWTVAWTVFLAVRLLTALRRRAQSGPLSPWLSEVDAGAQHVPLLARPFAPVTQNQAS